MCTWFQHTEMEQVEKQRDIALAAFKKAMSLVDVLKRQKVHWQAVHSLQDTLGALEEHVEGVPTQEAA